jgi:hypothetical protein
MNVAGDILAGLMLVFALAGCGGGGGGGGGGDAPGGDATLAGLSLSAVPLDQTFQPTHRDYNATAGYLATATTLTPTASDSAATVSVNGVKVASGASTAPIPLAVGANVITVVVTAADGVNTESYSIEVTRASASEFAQQAYLKASSTGLGGQFGYSVALSGDTLAVGVYREDSQARGIDGDSGDDSLSDAGAAYAFQ